MKKILTLAAALVVLGASTSMAQGLNLYWGNCGLGGGTTAATFACNTNTGLRFTVNASVFPAAPMNQFASASAIIDVSVSGGVLPPWWQTNTGQCRAGYVTISFSPGDNLTDCGDIWGFQTIVQVSAMQQGVNGPDRVRINGLAAIPAGNEIPLATGSELWLCKVDILRNNTVACVGCSQPATIVFNETKLLSPSEPQQVITNPADNYCVGWNGGVVSCPGATPTENRTWGAVKNLYR